MTLKVILLLCQWLCLSVYAVDYIGNQDTQRQEVFAKERSSESAQPFTTNISNRLTDPGQINEKLVATLKDREIIYKAVMGSIIAHDKEVVYNKHSSGSRVYTAHFNAFVFIKRAAWRLWDSVKQGTHLDSLEQITTYKPGQKLLTDYFIKWFYEALQAYRHERNFFGGMATFDWFCQTKTSYRKDSNIDFVPRSRKAPHQYVKDNAGHIIGILKPTSETQKKKGNNSWVVSIAAKAVGLNDVISPSIPVRIVEKGRELVIDLRGFTHILQPFVGFTQAEMQGGSPSAKLLENTLRTNQGLEEKKGQRGQAKSFTLTQRSFAQYFETASQLGSSPVTPEEAFEDLQFFNSLVNVESLAKLIVFWRLFGIESMPDEHLLWTFNTSDKSRFSIVCVSYDKCFVDPIVMIHYPPLSFFRQATQIISEETKRFLKKIDLKHLSQVAGAYPFLPEIQRLNGEAGSNAGVSEALQEGKVYSVSGALQEVSSVFTQTNRTIRRIMHNLYKNSERPTPFSQKPRSELYKEVDGNCTVFDFLEILPFGKRKGNTPKKLESRKSAKVKMVEHKLLKGFKAIEVGQYGGAEHYDCFQFLWHYDTVFSVDKIQDFKGKQYFSLVSPRGVSEFPGERVWVEGFIPMNLFFEDDYIKVGPRRG